MEITRNHPSLPQEAQEHSRKNKTQHNRVEVREAEKEMCEGPEAGAGLVTEGGHQPLRADSF